MIRTYDLDLNIHGHFHDVKLERCLEIEPELGEFYNEKNYRVMLENHYKPQLLDNLIKEGLEYESNQNL